MTIAPLVATMDPMELTQAERDAIKYASEHGMFRAKHREVLKNLLRRTEVEPPRPPFDALNWDVESHDDLSDTKED